MAIAVLPTHLVNKIAAGEVIERPASLVKELVENALDAGATRIDVAAEDGGRKLISVTDNGGGMGQDDLALAFAPHATSKISGEDDLFSIATMGFRGEALASVASVSHAHIRTRRPQDDGGFEVSADGESIEPVRPCAAAMGTTVTIRDLFFNTPARRKFLRTSNTEFGHVTEQLTRLALPHPHVAFTLTHNDRETQNLPAAETTGARVRDLFGNDLADALLPIAPTRGDVGVAGLIGRPVAVRSAAKWQYVFLNGRYIRDRTLSHALREAYRGLVDPRSYPVAFVFVEVNPADVDVNVHPTKIEVRFRDSQAVHGAALAALRQTLNAANLSPSADLPATALEEKPTDAAADGHRESLRQALADFFKSTPPPQPRLNLSEPSSDKARPAEHETFSPFESSPLAASHGPKPTQPDLSETGAHPIAPAPAAIQIHNTYVVTACDDGVMIVDQHALHERALYNELRHRLTAGKLTGQKMLIPETLKVTAAEAESVERQAELLARLGIEIGSFGKDTVAIHQFPSLLAERGASPAEFVREILDRLADDESTDSERVLEDLLQMMACKAAVKAGQPLSGPEIQALLARADELEKSSSCPHGRPTVLKLTLKDLEKQFKRT